MFSVVIPLYNKELSIKSTIQSVLDQTFQNFEVVIINDGSTDNSVKAAEAIDDRRIRLIHQSNQGVSAARNRGISEASYEWIAFLDADDNWGEMHLEEIYTLIKKFPRYKVFSTSFEFSDQREFFRHPRMDVHFVVNNYFKEARKEVVLWTSIVVVNKDCFRTVGMFIEHLSRGEDREMWARLARNYEIVKSNRVTAIYNIEDGESLSKGKAKYEKSIVSVIDLAGLKGDERAYFKRILFSRMLANIKDFHIWETIRIVLKHNYQLIL